MTSFHLCYIQLVRSNSWVSLQIRRGITQRYEHCNTLGSVFHTRKTRVAPLYPAEGKEQRSHEADGNQGDDGDITPDTSEATEPPPPQGHPSPSSSPNPEAVSEGDEEEEGDSQPTKLTSFSSRN